MENLLEEDTQFDEPTPDDVKNYMENMQAANEEEQGITPIDDGNGTKRIELGLNTTFLTTRNTDQYGEYANMVLTLQDDLHPITQKEKEDYLLACLNDELFSIELTMMRNFKVVCRDLNMYENQVVQRALDNYRKTFPLITINQMLNFVRQVRVPMQIVSINDKPQNMVQFEYDPETASDKQLDQDAETLANKSREYEMGLSYAKYLTLMKALNVFENKLIKLNEASFNENFWNPADQG